MTLYRTIDGDMVDAICYRQYGRKSALVDVLEANPGLADLGPVLAAGVIVTLPDLASPEPEPSVRLWD